MAIQLNNYIGQSFSCDCGKKHEIALKKIDIDQGSIERLPDHIKAMGYKKVFMVADVNTYEAAGKTAAKMMKKADIAFGQFVFPDKELVPDEKAVGSIMQAVAADADLLLVVGSGTLNDLCKFVSARLKMDYMVLATAPSMDGFVSVGAALITNHVKTTYDAHVPVAILADTDVLAQAPMEMIVAGFGDILGKYTCLVDWKMANIIEGEYHCEKIAGMVKDAIEVCVAQAQGLKVRDRQAVKSVMEALILTGIAMSFVGNSRPASGSEHHLSHYWEMQFQMEGKKPVLHGIKVGIGMIAVMQMYQKLIRETPDFDALKEKTFDYMAWEAKVKECYIDAADGILALEESCQKNGLEGRNHRLDVMKDHWEEITKYVARELPDVQAIESLMTDLGEPVRPEQIEVPEYMVKDAIILAKEVRNRYTILQMLWDMGLLESYASDL